MNAMLLARATAAGRVGFGVALLLTPLPLTGAWLWDDANSTGSQVLARALGMRDLVLGAGALTSNGEDLPRWLLAGAAADATDLVATLRAADLPQRGRILTAAAATAGLALGLGAVIGLRQDH